MSMQKRMYINWRLQTLQEKLKVTEKQIALLKSVITKEAELLESANVFSSAGVKKDDAWHKDTVSDLHHYDVPSFEIAVQILGMKDALALFDQEENICSKASLLNRTLSDHSPLYDRAVFSNEIETAITFLKSNQKPLIETGFVKCEYSGWRKLNRILTKNLDLTSVESRLKQKNLSQSKKSLKATLDTTKKCREGFLNFKIDVLNCINENLDEKPSMR